MREEDYCIKFHDETDKVTYVDRMWGRGGNLYKIGRIYYVEIEFEKGNKWMVSVYRHRKNRRMMHMDTLMTTYTNEQIETENGSLRPSTEFTEDEQQRVAEMYVRRAIKETQPCPKPDTAQIYGG